MIIKTNKYRIQKIRHIIQSVKLNTFFPVITVELFTVDINRHINNTRYGDILCGYIPEIIGSRVIQFEINYISEAPLGETVKVYMAKDDDGNYFFRTVRDGGKTNVEAEMMIEKI